MGLADNLLGGEAWADASITGPAENFAASDPRQWAVYSTVCSKGIITRAANRHRSSPTMRSLIDFLCSPGIHLRRRFVLNKRILPKMQLTVRAQLTHMYSTRTTVVKSETPLRQGGASPGICGGLLDSTRLSATAAAAVARGLQHRVAE